MRGFWTLGKKIGAGFGLMIVIIMVQSILLVSSMQKVIESKDWPLQIYSDLIIKIEKLIASNRSKSSLFRGFLLTGNGLFNDQLMGERDMFSSLVKEMQGIPRTTEGKEFLLKVQVAQKAMDGAQDQVLAMIKEGISRQVVSERFTSEVLPKVASMEESLKAFGNYEEHRLEVLGEEADSIARNAVHFARSMMLGAIVLGCCIGYFLSRLVNRQISSAIQHIQSSSSELQAAASQQSVGTKEQVTSISEISVTVKELLSTARQIAESAKRVASIAENTAQASQSGDMTVQKAQQAIQGIKRQVDVVVEHMMDLGKKSQEVGGILEIINELAEQTNILAINATIEAAGVGEAGKRFIVVADEIRKLSDRVGGSTKDIRNLVEEMRTAVNKTVMASEESAKTVESGTKQFVEVTSTFKQIVNLVETTTEASREIELSTKQQSTSVEQVNLAMANIAQTARESEASSSQSLQTASELAALARQLLNLIQDTDQLQHRST